MGFLLLRQPLFQGLHELFPTAHGLDLGLVLIGEHELRQGFQPFLRYLGEGNLHGALAFDTLEYLAEDAVETVEVAFILHQ